MKRNSPRVRNVRCSDRSRRCPRYPGPVPTTSRTTSTPSTAAASPPGAGTAPWSPPVKPSVTPHQSGTYAPGGAQQVYQKTDASINANDAGFIVGAAIANLC